MLRSERLPCSTLDVLGLFEKGFNRQYKGDKGEGGRTKKE